jgi:hypothetical protein
MDFEPIGVFDEARLAKRLAGRQKLWSHEFVRNLGCDPFLDGTATQTEIDQAKNSWNYSDGFFFDRINMDGPNR